MFPTSSHIDFLQSNLQGSLLNFLPELVVCGGIVLFLLLRLLKAFDRTHLGTLAAAILGVAMLPAAYSFVENAGWLDKDALAPTSYFSGMLVNDTFAGFVRILLLASAFLTVLVTLLTHIPDRDDSGDFYVLLLGGTLGMMLMSSANHLMMAFIAVEMASLPSYAMAGFLKGKKQGSEAALKYVVFGAGASGVMLYGISLLAGTFGTGYLPNVSSAVALRLADAGGLDPLALTGLALAFVGLGFKLSAFPFHFWCPDVFEGAAAEVAGFLSVASKTAAIALTVRVLQTLQVGADSMVGTAAAPFLVPSTAGIAVGVVGAITVTFGNLAAFSQTNLKRMLAYSTIAHAGYMLLGVSAVSTGATAAVLYYLFAYMLMNLGAFAVIALVRNQTGSEEVSAFRGLVWKSPVLAITMSLFLFSLLGLPPLAGFAGKFQVFASVYDAAKAAHDAGHARLGNGYFALLLVGAVNTAASAYYYLRVVRAMLLEDDANPGTACTVCGSGGAFLTLLAALLIAAGVVWNPISNAAERAAAPFATLASRPKPTIEPNTPLGKGPPNVVQPGGGNKQGGGGKGANPKKGPPA
jgi:NADH-quinone oxidoreductase subunit N